MLLDKYGWPHLTLSKSDFLFTDRWIINTINGTMFIFCLLTVIGSTPVMGRKKYFIKLFGLLAAFVLHFDCFMEKTWSIS